MDSRTKNALTELNDRLGVELQRELATILADAPEASAPTPELIPLIERVQELLATTYLWAASTPARARATKVQPTSVVTASPAPTPSTPSTPSPAAAAPAADMSDEEAMMLLADMDSPAPKESPKPAAAAAPAADMSDEEAMMLLADMDAPAAKEAPKAAAASTPAADMSDDEARRLLAAMDEPAPVAAPAPAAVAAPVAAPAPVAASVEDAGEIDEWAPNEFQSDADMLKGYINDTEDLMEKLNTGILALEQNPNDKETIEGIFRAAHTIKGSSGMFGFKAMERVMHRAENMFDLVRKGSLTPGSEHVDLMLKAMDVLNALIAGVKAGKPCGIKTAPIVNALTAAAQGKPFSMGDSPAAPAAPKPAEEKSASTASPAAPSAPSAPTAPAAAAPAGATAKPQGESTIRVDIERLDSLVAMIGELVSDRTRFSTIEQEMRATRVNTPQLGPLTETVQLFGRHLNEIQETTMKLRMVPIGTAFTKFVRVVRDLGRQLGKEINLVIEGEATELDKTIVEQIGDPLVHLVRNSCDHGVEMPDDRQKSGKPRAGTVRLSAVQEGNSIVIIIEDDGKGMDPERIRVKAIEKGLIAADAKLSQREIFNLIFEPGFSTAEKVTTVSGRGVGMDVVRKQITKLKGLIDIDSAVGKGSKITIRLPLTLAIVQNLLVNVSGETLAIPLSGVVESIRVSRKEIQHVGEAEVIKLRDRVLPLIHLDEVLNIEERDEKYWYDPPGVARKATASSHNDRLFVVVVGSAEWRIGLVVDQLISQQEMVIKGLGPLLKGHPCMAGGAVLGNGQVVLVVDIADLETLHRTRARQSLEGESAL